MTSRGRWATDRGCLLSLIALGVFVQSGCASRGPDLAETGAVEVLALPPAAFSGRVRVVDEGGATMVRGRVWREGGRQSQGGQVEVRVTGPEGDPLYGAVLPLKGFATGLQGFTGPLEGSHRPAPRRARPLDYFTVRFPGAVPPGARVEVRRPSTTAEGAFGGLVDRGAR